MSLTADQIKQLSQILIDLEAQLQADIDQAAESAKPVTLDQQAVGRVSRVDAIQQQQMQLAAVERMKKRLSMVKAALIRIDDEEFGHCVKCEELIEFERLKVRPESPLCVDCSN